MMAMVICLMMVTNSLATIVPADGVSADGEIAWYKEGLIVKIPGETNYQWWYGCSATSAGMEIGYYDRHGFDDLVLGGFAEPFTFPSTEGTWNYLVQYAIATPGHVNDFYSGGYLASGDDSYTTRDFDCLADFMGTSQDNLSAITGGNVNGGTTFFYYTDNSPLTESDIFALGVDYYNASGMYGLKEYLTWAGYDASTLYNQRIYGYDGIQEGFTYEQFKAEIDAGRPVLVHVKGHTMFGYGYGETDIPGSEYVYVNDTWTPGGWNPGFLYWGEGYPYWNGTAHIDLPMYGVTVMQVVPEPATIVLLSLGGLLFLRYKRIY